MGEKLTYGDLFKLLESRGFKRTAVDGPHALYERRPGKAAVVLPLYQAEVVAARMHMALVKQTMVDFGVMTDDEFERWAANPKRFKAA